MQVRNGVQRAPRHEGQPTAPITACPAFCLLRRHFPYRHLCPAAAARELVGEGQHSHFCLLTGVRQGISLIQMLHPSVPSSLLKHTAAVSHLNCGVGLLLNGPVRSKAQKASLEITSGWFVAFPFQAEIQLNEKSVWYQNKNHHFCRNPCTSFWGKFPAKSPRKTGGPSSVYMPTSPGFCLSTLANVPRVNQSDKIQMLSFSFCKKKGKNPLTIFSSFMLATNLKIFEYFFFYCVK